MVGEVRGQHGLRSLVFSMARRKYQSDEDEAPDHGVDSDGDEDEENPTRRLTQSSAPHPSTAEESTEATPKVSDHASQSLGKPRTTRKRWR